MDDSKIVDLFWQRSDQALRELNRKYGAMLFGIARHLLWTDEDAEEVKQDCLLALWENIPPARPFRLGAYAAKICRNLALKRIEYQNASKRSRRHSVSLEEFKDIIPSQPEQLQRLEEKELAKLMEEFLRGLQAEERQMFLLKYWFFATNQEIAERMGCSESKVKSCLYRSRKKCRAYLEKKGCGGLPNERR